MRWFPLLLVLILQPDVFSQIGPTGPGGGGGTGSRILNPTGTAAKCQAGVAATPFSFAVGATAPTAACESDGIQAYLDFTANTSMIVYDRFDLPANWVGTLRFLLTAYSTSGSALQVANLSFVCISNTAVASPSFGAAIPLYTSGTSWTPNGTSGRTISTTIFTPAQLSGCAVGNLVEWELSITAAAAADLHVLSVRFTE